MRIFLGYNFYLNANIYGDFQICISVPLIITSSKNLVLRSGIQVPVIVVTIIK